MTKKEAKKKQKMEKELRNTFNTPRDDADQIKTGIVLVVIIVVFLGLFYFIASVLTGDIVLKQKDYSVGEAKIQYDEILLGEALSMKQDKYYVLFYDSESSESDFLNSYNSTIRNSGRYIYTVDMASGFNKANRVEKVEDANNHRSKISSADDLKVFAPTVILVENGHVTKYVQEYDPVYDYLGEISNGDK